MDQFARLNVSDLNEIRFEGEYIWIGQGKGARCAFPGNSPVGSSPPSVPVDKERKVAVIEKEFAIHPLNVNWFDILFPGNEVQ
jgi:hypothetical protein